jgi:hypothetical protein
MRQVTFPTVAAVYDRRLSSLFKPMLLDTGKPAVIDRRYSGDAILT